MLRPRFVRNHENWVSYASRERHLCDRISAAAIALVLPLQIIPGLGGPCCRLPARQQEARADTA
jgi:hypothetical protein